MKNKNIILIILLMVVLIGICTLYKIKVQNNENDLVNSNTLQETTNNDFNIVIIKDNNIENENLIDEFIEKAIDTNLEKQELDIKQDNTNIKVIYTPGEYAKNSQDGDNIPASDGTFESNKEIYGYYTLIIDGEIKGEYPLGSHTIQRSTSEDIVTLYFNTPLIDYSVIPEICKYNLNSSNYSKKFDLKYKQRKDLGIKKVYDTDNYSIKTFGGDVDITIDDKVYDFEDALNKNVITPDDILEQAKIDLKYGICQDAYYSDGGSIEYMYNEYTILKLNTLDDEKDLVIGMKNQIINIYNSSK